MIAGTQIDHIRDEARALFPPNVYIPRAPRSSDEPIRPLPKHGLVYFLRFGNRIKIGFTTNLEQRLLALPHDEVLATIPGTTLDEKRCHASLRTSARKRRVVQGGSRSARVHRRHRS